MGMHVGRVSAWLIPDGTGCSGTGEGVPGLGLRGGYMGNGRYPHGLPEGTGRASAAQTLVRGEAGMVCEGACAMGPHVWLGLRMVFLWCTGCLGRRGVQGQSVDCLLLLRRGFRVRLRQEYAWAMGGFTHGPLAGASRTSVIRDPH